MSKPVILTGLRANNDLHLGNYLGALLPIVQMQKQYAGEYQINLFVPDLHSFTTPIDHIKLYTQTMHNLKLFVASGLDINNKDTFLYRQSFIPAHSELTVILNSFTYMGELRRMTQFKEKSKIYAVEQEINTVVNEYIVPKIQHLPPGMGQSVSFNELDGNAKNELLSLLVKMLGLYQKKESIGEPESVGLFDYPVLMAADILLYSAKYVPVGDDQTQHVELARDIALRMNNKFGEELFSPPEAEKEQIAFAQQQERLRIRDLADPSKKMSKSEQSDKGIIFLGDSPEAAAKKIMNATTDSIGVVNLDFDKQPGISNLLQIHAALSGETLEAVTKHHTGDTNYGDLKKEVAEQVKEFLVEFQAKLKDVDDKAIEAKLLESEKAMNEVANATLAKVQKAVGLRSK